MSLTKNLQELGPENIGEDFVLVSEGNKYPVKYNGPIRKEEDIFKDWYSFEGQVFLEGRESPVKCLFEISAYVRFYDKDSRELDDGLQDGQGYAVFMSPAVSFEEALTTGIDLERTAKLGK